MMTIFLNKQSKEENLSPISDTEQLQGRTHDVSRSQYDLMVSNEMHVKSILISL